MTRGRPIFSRRAVVRSLAALGLTAVAAPRRAAAGTEILTRLIPASGEALPTLRMEVSQGEVFVRDGTSKARQVAKDLAGSVEISNGAITADIKGAAGEDSIKAVHGISHDMLGQGGSFGYPLITKVGASLCKILKDRDSLDDRLIEAAGVHVASMRLILSVPLKDDGGPDGAKLVEELEKVCASVTA